MENQDTSDPQPDEWLGSSSDVMVTGGVADSSLAYLCRREYTIDCNWKVVIVF